MRPMLPATIRLSTILVVSLWAGHAAAQEGAPIATEDMLRAYSRPIDPDRYLIRPGERLKATFVRTRLSPLTITVDAEGRVVHNDLGVIDLAGQTFSEARQALGSALKAVYNAEEIVISVEKPYPVTVEIVGAVARPGRYSAYTSQTVADVIDSAGGLSADGSRRFIRIVAGDRQIPVDLDRAEYFGDSRANPCLYAGNKIEVPLKSEECVQVVGAVRTPRMVELVGGETFDTLMILAGGPSHIANVGASYIVGKPASYGSIEPGDIIVVPARASVPSDEFVTLFGAMHQIGRFAFSQGMNLGQLLDKAGGALENANLNRVTIFRRPEPDAWGGRLTGRYPISLQGDDAAAFRNIKLTPMDSVYVPVRFGYVRLTGSVQNPGLYPYQSGEDVAFYVRRAAGYLDESITTRLEIHDRVSSQTFEATEQTLVRDGDEVLVRPVENIE